MISKFTENANKAVFHKSEENFITGIKNNSIISEGMINKFGVKGIETIEVELLFLKLIKNEKILHFEIFLPFIDIDERRTKLLFLGLSHLKNLNFLKLELEKNNIGSKGAE